MIVTVHRTATAGLRPVHLMEEPDGMKDLMSDVHQ